MAVLLALGTPIVSGAPALASGGGGEGLHLVPMDEIVVPIVDGNRADGNLRIKLVLEAKDGPAADKLTASLPLLRATSLSAAIEFARLYASPMMPVDAGRLSADMTAALRRADPGIARVLIVEVAAVRA